MFNRTFSRFITFVKRKTKEVLLVLMKRSKTTLAQLSTDDYTHRVISDKVHGLLVTLSYFQPDRFVQLLSPIPTLSRKSHHVTVVSRGGFRGGRGGADAPSPQGFDPLPTQRVPPLILFQKSIFGGSTLKFF